MTIPHLTEAKEVLPGVTKIPTVSKLMGTFIKYPPFEENPQFIGMPELSLALATVHRQHFIGVRKVHDGERCVVKFGLQRGGRKFFAESPSVI